MASVSSTAPGTDSGQLHRTIDWKGAFWVASGVPALVLFSIGGIAGTVGVPAFAVWAVSMLFGFVQSFTYAEIAGLFANKSGGAAVYGAAAWLRYSKLIAPLSVWCNWFAWTPVLSLGCAVAAGYILNALAPLPVFTPDSPQVVSWLQDAHNSAAIAGKSGADAAKIAITALTDAATPALRSFKIASFSFFGLANIEVGS